jgi:putative glutamine amidotransferase
MKSNRKPLIGITAGEIVNKHDSWSPITHGQSVTYVRAIVNAGGVPVILPLIDDESLNREMYEQCAAIVFAGGNDVDLSLYGQERHVTTEEPSKVRDAIEMRLMQWSLEDMRPILGICRGMEILNIVRGGSLYQDIPSMLPGMSDHDASTKERSLEHIAHQVRLEPHSRFARIIDAVSIGTNTHHHQAIKDLGRGLRAVGWSEDSIIEIIEASEAEVSFIVGVQSHPESMENAVPEWHKIFREFVSQAAARS